MKYVCTICGYIYDEAKEGTTFDALGDDWVCPLCGAPKAVFEKLEEKESSENEVKASNSTKYVCTICGYIYDEAIEAMPFDTLPNDWQCPVCGAPKTVFEKKEDVENVEETKTETKNPDQWNPRTMSALCSNLAKGCEKQYLAKEASLFMQLADYFEDKADDVTGDINRLANLIDEDLNVLYKEANQAANEAYDRGAKRVLLWSEKATRIQDSILKRYAKEQDEMLNNTNIYVCEICGFVYVGDTPPEICPICKVPSFKLQKVERS